MPIGIVPDINTKYLMRGYNIDIIAKAIQCKHVDIITILEYIYAYVFIYIYNYIATCVQYMA